MSFRSSSWVPEETEETAGILSLDEYRLIESRRSRIQELKDHGLSSPRIMLQMEQEGHNAKQVKRNRTKAHPDFLASELNEIQEQIDKKKQSYEKLETEEKISAIQRIGRHAREVEASILQGKKDHPLAHLFLIEDHNLHHQLLKTLQKDLLVDEDHDNKQSHDKPSDDDKANHVGDINDSESNKRQKLDPNNHILVVEEHKTESASEKPNNEKERNELQSDSKVTETQNKLKSKKKSRKKSKKSKNTEANPTPGTTSTISTTPLPTTTQCTSTEVPTTTPTTITRSVIDENRITHEQIMADFQNYEAGTPSNVLYLKNLGKQVTVADLAGIFNCFQPTEQGSLSIKLMTHGRMKGQAFITFQYTKAASLALQSVNGFVFKGKPIILSYGKQKSMNPTETSETNCADQLSLSSDNGSETNMEAS